MVLKESESTDLVPVVEDENFSNWDLKQLAELHYVTFQGKVSLSEMSRMSPFNRVTERTLFNWSSKDEWVRKRSEYQQQLFDAVRRKIGTQHVQATVSTLDQLGQITQEAYQKLIPMELESEDGSKMTVTLDPKTWSSVATVYERLVARLHEIRKDIHDHVVPAVTPNEGGPAEQVVKPRLTEEEARAAAMLLVKMRRNDIEREIEEGHTDGG